MSQKSGKVVIMKDINNVQAKVLAKLPGNDLEALITRLKAIDGDSYTFVLFVTAFMTILSI